MRLSRDSAVGAAICAFGMAALAASFGVGSTSWGGESARLFPMVMSLAIAAMGGQLAFNGLRRAPPVARPGREVSDAARLLLLGLLYVLAIGKVGYLVATAFAAPAALAIFGVRSVAGLIAAAVLCPVAYHLVFFVALGVFPPYGSWFDLLDVLQGR